MADRLDRTEFSWNVHSYLNEYIRHADTKAELVIAWTSALVGALVAGKYQDKFDYSLSGIMSLAGFLLLVSGFITAFQCVKPRLKSLQIPGFIFWDSILAHKDRDTFLGEFANLSDESLGQHVSQHLFDLSNVAHAKYWWVGISIRLACAGSLLSGLMYLL